MAAATTAGIDRNVEITSLSHCCPTYVGIMPTASETKLSANCLCCVVQVVVGYLVYSVGQLQYQKLESSGGGDGGDYWIVGSAVVGGAMLTVICIILVVYKRKSTRAQRQFKRLQLQLDSLESNIRNECKQGTRSPLPPRRPPAEIPHKNRRTLSTRKLNLNSALCDFRSVLIRLYILHWITLFSTRHGI